MPAATAPATGRQRPERRNEDVGPSARRVRVAGSPSVASLAGCATIREARGGPGQRLDPWENWNRKVFDFNEDARRGRAEAGRDRLHRCRARSRCAAASATSSATSPTPGRRSTTCCRASSARLRGRRRGSATNTLVRAVRRPRRRVRDGPRPPLRGLRPDARPLRRRRRRLLVLPMLGPSTVRDAVALPLDRAASPPAFFDRHRHADRPHGAADRQHARRACSARRG